MQAIARELDVTVIFSPKCHPEFAGEGLEYFWAFLKNAYRKIPYHLKKKKKEDFLRTVDQQINKTHIQSVRRFARRARQYICAYYSLQNGTEYQSAIPQEKIERMMKKFRAHRSALDFDQGFITATVKGDTTKDSKD